ncbi:hypothetical protein QRX50_33915 [Amycolatopsis carbonis]|uniref:Uncharacterized protein n=1 Tax=Amycolatopsis carbonis TaxID=715471 RepID=A0A9Y2MV73_9PSEU|nr:hypothetical protein [Amycolatopsis sp. 2-15]WIX76437.1 hypothetical protein QRX50_33915 [Amycolatopsis sp. 2-15]
MPKAAWLRFLDQYTSYMQLILVAAAVFLLGQRVGAVHAEPFGRRRRREPELQVDAERRGHVAGRP